MGTRFEIVLPAGDEGPGAAALVAAGEVAIDEIDQWHRRLNRFSPDSLVSHINRGGTQPVRLDRETFDLFSDALEVWRMSDRAFDITVTPLLVADGARDSAVPAGRARVHSGMIDLDPAARTIRLAAAGLSIDLGGIAKGHALDCAAAVLRDAGVSAALLHGGTSSVLAMGRPRAGSDWRVALGPFDTDIVTLTNASLSLSDPAGQARTTRREHILDPRGGAGRSVRGTGTASARVAVIGPSARMADAWSTALAVLGAVPASFPQGYEARFLAHSDGARTHAIAAS